MEIYRGSLRIEGDDAPSVDCVVTVGDRRLSITSAGQEIGQWSLDDVGLSRTSDGFRLEVEGERLLLFRGLTRYRRSQIVEVSSDTAKLSFPLDGFEVGVESGSHTSPR